MRHLVGLVLFSLWGYAKLWLVVGSQESECFAEKKEREEVERERKWILVLLLKAFPLSWSSGARQNRRLEMPLREHHMGVLVVVQE